MTPGDAGRRRAESGRRSPAEIEGETESTRAELGQTMDALARKLAPKHLLGEGIDMITEYVGGKAVGNALGAAFRANRTPLALIAAGVGWLVASNTGIADRVVRAQRTQAARRRVDGLADDHGIGSRAEPETAIRPGEQALGPAGESLREKIERHPLLIGLVGIVSGAMIAALLPPTKREQEWADKARGELWRKAGEIGHEAAGRVRNLAECPARTAQESATADRPHAL